MSNDASAWEFLGVTLRRIRPLTARRICRNEGKLLFMIRELFDLTGKTALITGGSRGLGFDIARGAAELGARVILLARSKDQLSKSLASIDAPSDRKAAISADLADLNAIPDLVERAVREVGPIDILVNNAGINWVAPAESFPKDQWLRVIDVNLNAPFLLAKEIARACMIPRKCGCILNIASIGGLIGNPPQLHMSIAPYNASKGGLISLTRALASEWGHYGINVNALCPGFFITDMSREFLEGVGNTVLPTVPLGRFGGQRDLVGPALLLISAAGRHITGETIVVDGGMTSAS
ncbi:MAG: SDR family NAD(P)-dependent oxidoreductase [Steroidobacteraceae bacterium]